MKYKLFAVDLDGTLLDREGRIRPSDLAAMRQMQSAGVHLTIVTGRLYSGSREAARMVGGVGPVACVDGSHIVDARTDAELFHDPIGPEQVERVRAALRQHRPASFVFAQDEIVHDEGGEPFLPYVKTWSKRLVRHHAAVEHPHWSHARGVSAVVCVGLRETIEATAGEIRASLGEAGAGAQVVSFPVRNVFDHEIWGMVVRASSSSKGTALAWLSRHHGVSLDEVVAVGDWLNDLPMFRVAGRSFAMGQAPDAVKAAASDVLEASSEAGGGIAEAARRAGLVEA